MAAELSDHYFLLNELGTEKKAVSETGEFASVEKNSFYYRFSELMADATDELEKALEMFKQEAQGNRRMDLLSAMGLNMAIYKIGLELLMRRNPQVRDLANTIRENSLAKLKAHEAWEKELLATEGREEVVRRMKNGEGPIHQYTPEELDRDVQFTKAQVDAGILKPSDLQQAIEVREAEGYYQWRKERDRKNEEEDIKNYAVYDPSDVGRIIQNATMLNERTYGKEYAERRREILTELASIAATQKSTSSQQENTID